VREVPGAWRRLWDLVPDTAAAMAADLQRLGRELPARRVWGAVPAAPDRAPWAAPVTLAGFGPDPGAAHVVGTHPVLVGPDVVVDPGACLDAREGPVVLGAGVHVLPGAYLAGPLFVGSGSQIKAGASVYGETSVGAVCKVGGEVAESTLLDFVNKQHEGFIGHAYVGSWCNLGALTTCSDLKNTYGEIRVDMGSGPEPTGQRFVGVLMGEHAKTAIGTVLNTGTTVGFASNVFGRGFPAKALRSFTWGDGHEEAWQDPRRAVEVAEVVMQRRGCRLTAGHEKIFTALG
jgi:UDP-N-acetylglucosamine diphosphorylase/glucosamine-1-phosphate N-acetyltransferase